jgi:heat shock protein HslJ
MQTEREFLDGLKAANRFEIRDERLMLYRDRELLLTFRGEAK